MLLGIISWIVPKNGWIVGKHTLRWPTLNEIINGDKEIESAFQDSILIPIVDSTKTTPTDTIQNNITIINETLPSISKPIPPTVNIANIDTRINLATFYQALDSADKMPIRVVHYGDSQIEEDRITNTLRERLQTQYGGGGPGLLPLHQTIPTRTIRQWLSINGNVQNRQGGPRRYLVYGPRSMRKDSNDYGVMGQVAVMDSTLVANSEQVVMNVEPLDKKRKSHNYFNCIRMLSDGISGYVLVQDTTIHLIQNKKVNIPDSSTHCEIHLYGKGNVYGISLETSSGVIIDNIPMRGCSGNIFTRINRTLLNNYFQTTNTRLIILQFGGNMIPQSENPSTMIGYVKTLRQQVRYMQSCAPKASILFIGPSDMSTRINGEMATYPLLPYLDNLLLKMAQEEGIAYWSMYQAMGGRNSMVEWHKKGLAGSDYVHFTRAGANKVGRMLSDWIYEGKDLIQIFPTQFDKDSIVNKDSVVNKNTIIIDN